MHMTITSRPDPDYCNPTHRHLWLLVGDTDYFDGAYAFYLGPDSDIDDEPIAESRIDSVIQSAEAKGVSLRAQQIQNALDDYREARRANRY